MRSKKQKNWELQRGDQKLDTCECCPASKTLQQYIHEKEWYPTNQQRTFLHYAADDADKSKQTFLYDELEERLGNIENSLGKSRAVPEYKTTFSTL